MKQASTRGTLLATALVLAAASAASVAAPPMSVDAQALAHWVHFTRLNLNLQHADAPFIVVDGDQLRWWLVDPKGRWSGHGPALLLPAAERAAGGVQPVSVGPPGRLQGARARGSGG